MATQFSGGTYIDTTFVPLVKSDFQVNIAAALISSGWTSKAIASGQGLGNTGIVTISIANPGVVTFNSHGFLGNEAIILQTSGTLPSGLSVNTIYYVNYIDANTFHLASSPGGGNITTTGSQSGTHTLNTQYYLLESTTQTNVTNPIRVRLIDNVHNCIQVHIESQDGTIKSSNQTNQNYGGELYPNIGKTFGIIATQYHFLCFVVGAGVNRDFVMAGMLYVPSFITGIANVGYMLSNADSDGDTSLRSSFRVGVNLYGGGTQVGNLNSNGNTEVIWDTNFLEGGNSSNFCQLGGGPEIVIPEIGSIYNLVTRGYLWANGDINTSDVLLTSGLTSQSDVGTLKGQFFDLIYVAEAFTIDATDTFNSHNWYNLTNNNNGASNYARGSMWIATS